MLRGEIEILIRDSETMEVVDRIVQPNVVTNAMFAWLTSDNSNAYVPGAIVAESCSMSPSRTQIYIPGNIDGNLAVMGTQIPGNGYPDFFPVSGMTPAFAQWSTRLPLPPATWSIATILLTNCPGQFWLNNPSVYGVYNYEVFAYSLLATPCIQTTTQFFDIYYRVYFPLTNSHDMPLWLYEDMVARMCGVSSVMNGTSDYRIYENVYTNPLPPVIPNSGDVGVTWPSWAGVVNTDMNYIGFPIAQSVNYRRKYSQSFALTDFPGMMMGTLFFTGGNGQGITSYVPVNIGTNIQNLLGHRSTSQEPFLDVSNLQQGTGVLTLGGSWSNTATLNPGYFTTGTLPQMYFINVTGSGMVGTATYTYSSRPWTEVFCSTTIGGSWLGTWRQPLTPLPWISQSMNTNGGYVDPETGNNLLGNLNTMGVRQLSSWCKYDATSVVIVQQNRIIVYNIATGYYWTYTGGFTDVRQVAVIGTKIYISCHSTGLYMIDPPNSTSVTGPIAPGGGIDLSVTYGVAMGYNNYLWVVGNNCLASFDGTSTWTLYNATSATPFNITGVSNGLWSNIEYLVVDSENSFNEMLLVRSATATVNAASLGVWWSTIGSATNAGNEPQGSGTFGAPRVNRSHVGGRNNIWVVLAGNNYRQMSFGTTTMTASSLNVNTSYGQSFQAVLFEKDSSGNTCLLSLGGAGYTEDSPDGNINNWARPNATLLSGSPLTSEVNIASAMMHYLNDDQLRYVAGSGSYSSSSYDLCTIVNLGNGVIVIAGYHNSNYSAGRIAFTSYLGIYPFDLTSSGGAMAFVGQKTYGWNGSAWSTSSVSSKTTHSSTQALDSGITISFADGSSGTSYIAGDWYNFVCAQGMQKDAATTGSFQYSFYYKKSYRNQTTLSSATIPYAASQTLPTGAVGLDILRSSANDITLVGGQFVFNGCNPQQFAVGDKQVTGSFNVSYAAFNSVHAHYIAFGIGHAGSGQICYGFVISNDSIYICDTPNDSTGIFAYPSLHGSFGNFSTSTTLAIQRVGGILEFLVNGVVKWTNATMPLGQLRWDLICSPYGDWQPTDWTNGRICPATTVITGGNDNAVKIGTALSSTGAFNPLFFWVDSDSLNVNTVTIGGTPALAYHYDGTAPGATEVGIDPYMGTMYFNTADEGKAIAATYTYLTHE